MGVQRGDFSSTNCHAIVVGTGRYGKGGRVPLSDLPGAARSARAIAAVLREECGMDGRVTEIIDARGPTEVLAAVQVAIDASEGGVVLFYFIGHGLIGPGRQLYLATSGTVSADDTVQAVPYDQVSKRLGEATASTVVILDCCFSGLAQTAPQESYREVLASARPEGSFLLASATHYAASFAPADAVHTLFSGELLRLLKEGDPGGPAWFTLLDLYRILDHRFQGSAVRPHSDGVGRASDLILVRNPGRLVHDAAVDTGPEQGGGPCPYPGMRPFLPEQHHLFFGRDDLTRNLVARVTADPYTGPVVVVGASGAGKSSLLRAGLVAGLEGRGVVLVPAPGARPFHTLVESWASAVGRPFAEVESELGTGRFGHTGPRVLVIDQFEEIFTQCQDVEERELFVRALSGAGSDGPRIVLGLRADFYDQGLNDARLAAIIRAGQFTVTAMSDDDLRAAVERPAEHSGLRLEDGLCDHILSELRQERAAEGDAVTLPFLAHALRQTWAGRRGTTLTFSAYQAVGGIRASVARTADQIHDTLGDDDRIRLRDLLLRMVLVVGDSGRTVRRRVPARELDQVADLVGRLVEARLVVVDQDEAQLCHDSLLHAWPQLREWIADDRVGLLARRRLGEAADGWQEAGRPQSGLYKGDQLAAARTQLAGSAGTLPTRPVEREFLNASHRSERRSVKLRRAGLSALAVLALLATMLAAEARDAQREAERRETVLRANQVAAQADALRERDPQTALRLSLAAYRTAETYATRSSLYTSYLTHTPVEVWGGNREPVLNVAYSRDGDVLAASHRGGRVQLWDTSRRNVPVKAGTLKLKGSTAIAFHPRTRLLAAQTATELLLWDAADPQRPKRLAGRRIAEGITYAVGFAPDGRTLAAGSEEGRLRLWDVSNPSSPLLRTDRPVAATALISLAFRRDGLLVTGNGISGKAAQRPAEVRLWDARDPARARLLDTVTTASVMAVAAHPTRDLLVATGAEGKMAWWTVGSDSELKEVKPENEWNSTWGGLGDLTSLSFRPDGERIAAAYNGEGNGGALLRKTVATGAKLLASQAELGTALASEPAQSLVYSPDGRHLAVGDVGGRIRIWPHRAPALQVTGAMTDGDPGTSPISGDGKLLVAKSADTTQVWDLSKADTADGDDPSLRFTLPKPWEARYFLPGTDRPLLMAHRWTDGTDNHAFRLWDFGKDGNRPPVPGAEISVKAEDMRTAVSADGRLLVLGGRAADTVDVWDIGNIHRPVARATLPAVAVTGWESMFFLGERGFAIADRGDPAQGRVPDLRIWDLTDPARPVRGRLLKDAAVGKSGYVPSARLLMHDAPMQQTQLWDMRDIRNPRKAALLPAASGGYMPVGKSLLATTLIDGTVNFWDASNPFKPRKMDERRFDQALDDISPSPDGKWVLTGPAYRIWKAEKDGRWRTPAIATVKVGRLTLLPGGSPFMVVVPDARFEERYSTELTYLMDFHTERIHERLCRTHPLSVERKQWNALLPHLNHQSSCN
ncbi:caspase, EACC1-associated type [Streptomyces albipurpureus]|uniref:Caspase family protein n=1 Tax=Streptomyces albipurpureus TaxID=2897419 RepID=A0ABT0UI30_9ACTN|nr:caspase family protein [Streptomyces sp. CWNU-1]MCM2388287.1 caspase family protein [Streptomyces sp. CWNU-1]